VDDLHEEETVKRENTNTQNEQHIHNFMKLPQSEKHDEKCELKLYQTKEV